MLEHDALASDKAKVGSDKDGAKASLQESKQSNAAKKEDDIAFLRAQIESIGYTTARLSSRIDELQQMIEDRLSKSDAGARSDKSHRHHGEDGEYDRVFDNIGRQLNKSGNYDNVIGAHNYSGKNVASAAGMAAYKNAYHSLQLASAGKKDFAESRAAFAKFIEDFPENSMIGSAYYWIAETYMYEKKYSKAAIEYLKGYEAPSGERSADNLLGLAKALSKINRSDEACTVIIQLNKEFTDADVGIKNEAKRISDELACDDM